MRGLKFFDKIVFLLNVLFALLLLIAYILPYLPTKSFSFVSVLSLGVPLLIIINLGFLLYWILKTKRQLLLPLIVLLLGFNYITSIYKLTASKTIADTDNFSVMSYNVRLFNLFEWLPTETVSHDIKQFIKDENPSIVCLQEYHKNEKFQLEDYYKFEAISEGAVKSGQAIFSKFPIINSGSISFSNTSNKAVFVDVIKKDDTLRIYNLHLQSSKISTDVNKLKQDTSENLTRQIEDAFKMQQAQTELVLKHKKACRYKTIIAGDFNNTAYSYIYNKLKQGNQDAFEVAGSGFGKTFDFNFIPLRIDFIIADTDFLVNGFKNYDIKLSDHFPIKAVLK